MSRTYHGVKSRQIGPGVDFEDAVVPKKCYNTFVYVDVHFFLYKILLATSLNKHLSN